MPARSLKSSPARWPAPPMPDAAALAAMPGADVYAGTLNLTGTLRIKVRAAEEGTLLAEVQALLDKATENRSAYVQLADRAARLYAPVVHATALLTFLGWLAFGIGWHDALIIAITVLIITCVTVLFLTAGSGGAEAMSHVDDPLVQALGGEGTAAKLVNYIGLAGLIASFFSIIYAYSRQTFALSRAGYLPTTLSITNKRKAPTLALIVPGIVGFLLSLTGHGDLILNMAVFGAALSYVLMMVLGLVLMTISALWMLYALLFAVIFALTAIVLAVARRYRGRAAQDKLDRHQMMSNFRELYDRGGLSDEEFRTIRSKLATELKAELKDNSGAG